MMGEPAYEPTDRRPIKSRDTRWAHAIAHRLATAGVSPNAISVFGMFAASAAGVAFAITSQSEGVLQRALWIGGALLVQVRLLCNLFDGMVAIARDIASPTGELYNEVPDRISDAAVMIGLGYASTGHVIYGYLAALVSVFVAYVRAMVKAIGAPNDFCGPMGKPQRMAIVTVLGVYLCCAPESWRWNWGEARVVLAVIVVGGATTALRRLWRAARFLREQKT
jgi:phosphatidylglycerophosphate synthase